MFSIQSFAKEVLQCGFFQEKENVKDVQLSNHKTNLTMNNEEADTCRLDEETVFLRDHYINPLLFKTFLEKSSTNEDLQSISSSDSLLPRLRSIARKMSQCQLQSLKILNSKNPVKLFEDIRAKQMNKSYGSNSVKNSSPMKPPLSHDAEFPSDIVVSLQLGQYNRRKELSYEIMALCCNTLSQVASNFGCKLAKMSGHSLSLSGIGISSYFFNINGIFYATAEMIAFASTISNWINEDAERISYFCHNSSSGATVKELSSNYDPSLWELDIFPQDMIFAHPLHDKESDETILCEHFLNIHQQRLFHSEIDGNIEEFPKVTFRQKFRHKKCVICEIYIATRVAIDDKTSPENPCYYCDHCFDLYHYDENGNLLCEDFTVQPFYYDY